MFTESLAYPRFRAQLISAFAGIAAVLAALGLFSVLAYLVEQRTRELAVRRAVGAQASDLIRLIAGHGLRLVTIGLVLGLISGLAVARLLGRLLFEISPWDMRTYIGAAALLGMAAFLGILFPALRVIRIDPLIALRYE
jgi:putative ABC transport system permease protein